MKNSNFCLNCGQDLGTKYPNKKFCNKSCYNKYHRKNGDQVMWDKKWKQNHPEVYRARAKRHKITYLQRHPEKRYSSKGIKKEAFEKMRAEFNYTCPICDQREPFLNQYWPRLVQDHIVPRSLNGRKRAKENIQPLCWDCNTKKSNLTCPTLNV